MLLLLFTSSRRRHLGTCLVSLLTQPSATKGVEGAVVVCLSKRIALTHTAIFFINFYFLFHQLTGAVSLRVCVVHVRAIKKRPITKTIRFQRSKAKTRITLPAATNPKKTRARPPRLPPSPPYHPKHNKHKRGHQPTSTPVPPPLPSLPPSLKYSPPAWPR